MPKTHDRGAAADPHRRATALLALCLLAGRGVAAPALDGGLQINERVDYYDIDATEPREIVAQLRERRPVGVAGPSDALTDVTLEARYELEPVAHGCRLAEVRVQATIVVSLPRLLRSAFVDGSVMQRWQRMLHGLRVHEQGHSDEARRAAERLYEALLALPAAADCHAARRHAGRMTLTAVLALTLRGEAYDRRTGHGRTQGAVF